MESVFFSLPWLYMLWVVNGICILKPTLVVCVVVGWTVTVVESKFGISSTWSYPGIGVVAGRI